MEKEIAVLILNWNKVNSVINLLNQLFEVSEPKFDIFVVDNASTDNSVISIRDSYPSVTLIINDQNLGGTGGFNSGIDYILRINCYKYIWLLDNDVEIGNDTLSKLYNVMECDSEIGIAGSRIVDIDNKEITVEAGSNFRWDLIGVKPVEGNTKDFKDENQIINVDYVAICSALVNIEAIKKVGLMDERYFLFWDDMDWGLNFHEKGFKVVSVASSVAYHGSFSERDRGMFTNFYYGIRNSLLTYTKHTSYLRRSVIFYRSLQNFYRNYYFFNMIKKNQCSILIKNAIQDYLQNKWGKICIEQIPSLHQNNTAFWKNKKLEKCIDIKKILVSLNGNTLAQNRKMLNSIRAKYPKSEITAMVHNHRASYYAEYHLYLIDENRANRICYMFGLFVDIYKKKYDVVAFISPSAFIGAVKRSVLLDKNGNFVSEDISNLHYLSLQIQSFLFGAVKTFVMFPSIMFASIKYCNIRQ